MYSTASHTHSYTSHSITRTQNMYGTVLPAHHMYDIMSQAHITCMTQRRVARARSDLRDNKVLVALSSVFILDKALSVIHNKAVMFFSNISCCVGFLFLMMPDFKNISSVSTICRNIVSTNISMDSISPKSTRENAAWLPSVLSPA
eukprot:m.146992 g.146992  ORF g.146992 m.146992 type:complete len:146 (-) comp30512_c0_seq2:103-540(-)